MAAFFVWYTVRYMAIHVEQVSVGGYDKNFSYVLSDTETNAALIVDPCGDIRVVLNMIQEKSLELQGILLTHSHPDHFDQLDAVLAIYNVPVYVHQEGVSALSVPARPLIEGQLIPLGVHVITVLWTPGHTKDSVCYFIAPDASDRKLPMLLTGDTLFVHGCGKIAKEDAQTMFDTLQRLKQFADETVIMPGHDYGSNKTSVMGTERENNLYLMASTLEAFMKVRFPDE